MSTFRDGNDLHLAFRCVQTSEPFRWREMLEACRTSRRERKIILKQARENWAFKILYGDRRR